MYEQKCSRDWLAVEIICPIYKKDHSQICNNFREITVGKLYDKILENGLTKNVYRTMEESQSELKKKGTNNHIGQLRSEKAMYLVHQNSHYYIFDIVHFLKLGLLILN